MWPRCLPTQDKHDWQFDCHRRQVARIYNLADIMATYNGATHRVVQMIIVPCSDYQAVLPPPPQPSLLPSSDRGLSYSAIIAIITMVGRQWLRLLATRGGHWPAAHPMVMRWFSLPDPLLCFKWPVEYFRQCYTVGHSVTQCYIV